MEQDRKNKINQKKSRETKSKKTKERLRNMKGRVRRANTHLIGV